MKYIKTFEDKDIPNKYLVSFEDDEYIVWEISFISNDNVARIRSIFEIFVDGEIDDGVGSFFNFPADRLYDNIIHQTNNKKEAIEFAKSIKNYNL